MKELNKKKGENKMKQISKYDELILTILEALNQQYDRSYGIDEIMPMIKEKMGKAYSFSYIRRQLKNLCDIGAVTITRHYAFPSSYKLMEYGREALLGLKESKKGGREKE